MKSWPSLDCPTLPSSQVLGAALLTEQLPLHAPVLGLGVRVIISSQAETSEVTHAP